MCIVSHQGAPRSQPPNSYQQQAAGTCGKNRIVGGLGLSGGDDLLLPPPRAGLPVQTCSVVAPQAPSLSLSASAGCQLRRGPSKWLAWPLVEKVPLLPGPGLRPQAACPAEKGRPFGILRM